MLLKRTPIARQYLLTIRTFAFFLKPFSKKKLFFNMRVIFNSSYRNLLSNYLVFKFYFLFIKTNKSVEPRMFFYPVKTPIKFTTKFLVRRFTTKHFLTLSSDDQKKFLSNLQIFQFSLL